MHRCLQIPEILRTILEEVLARSEHYEWLPPIELYTYAAMARTCKAFYDPSMDCLWATLPTLDPLANCMPLVVANGCIAGDANVDIAVSGADCGIQRSLTVARSLWS